MCASACVGVGMGVGVGVCLHRICISAWKYAFLEKKKLFNEMHGIIIKNEDT